MKKLITLIISIILIFVMSLGAFTLFGCGRDIEPESGNVPSANTPNVDDPNDGGNDGGGSNGNGGGGQTGSGGGSNSGNGSVSSGNNQTDTSVQLGADTIWKCSACGTNNPGYKSTCGGSNCDQPKP